MRTNNCETKHVPGKLIECQLAVSNPSKSSWIPTGFSIKWPKELSSSLEWVGRTARSWLDRPAPEAYDQQDFIDGDDVSIKAHWALLIAGSNGWGNYRHQADVAHAYHVLRQGGLSEHRIVVMMYDDIANNYENPFPGKIFNSPGNAWNMSSDDD